MKFNSVSFPPLGRGVFEDNFQIIIEAIHAYLVENGNNTQIKTIQVVVNEEEKGFEECLREFKKAFRTSNT